MEKIQKAFKKARRILILSTVATIIIGTIFILAPKTSGLIICYLIAAALTALGAYYLFDYFFNRKSDSFGSGGIVIGVTLIALGVVFFVNTEEIKGFLAIVIGIIMLVDSVAKLGYALDLKRIEDGKWWSIAIPAAVIFALGLFTLIFPGETKEWFMVYIGIMLVIDGISDLYTMLYIGNRIKTVLADDEDEEEDLKEING